MQEIMQFVSRHPVLSIAWIGLLAAVLFTTFKGLTSKVKVITRGEATRLINKEDAVVVDLRQRPDRHVRGVGVDGVEALDQPLQRLPVHGRRGVCQDAPEAKKP